MVWRILFFSGLALGAFKIFWPDRLRAFGARVDRVVNAILIAIAIVYSLQLVWLALDGGATDEPPHTESSPAHS